MFFQKKLFATSESILQDLFSYAFYKCNNFITEKEFTEDPLEPLKDD
jgi:hypothetical protein